jgi:SAM-dependent methyltransferase
MSAMATSEQHVSLSPRLAEIVDALPLRPGMRILEIGGAPGAAARAVVERIGDGHVLVIDRSAKGVAMVERLAAAEIAAGRMSVRCVAAEDFELAPEEAAYDLAFAIRVGALDGRHPRQASRPVVALQLHWCPAGSYSLTAAIRSERSSLMNRTANRGSTVTRHVSLSPLDPQPGRLLMSSTRIGSPSTNECCAPAIGRTVAIGRCSS